MEKKKEKILYDKEKPSLDDIEVKADMEMVYNVELLADVIVEGGIEIIFGLTGGHQWPFEGPVMKRGIPRVHVHHECTAPFAGDAWGRIKGKPAAVSLTAGPGMMNAVSGVMQAKQAQSPMFLFCGAHPTTDDDRFPIQEGYAEYSLGPCTKYVRRVVSPYTSVFQTKRALRACQTPPMGPVALEFPLDTVSIVGKIPKSVALTGYARGFFPPRDLRRFMADPALVEEAVKWILGAEKPTIIVGEGVHYDDAASELNEFVKLLGIPCHSRRVGRGAFSEYDYLNCYGRARGKVMRASDRCLVIGLRVAYLENFGYPPFWGHDTRYIQINHCVENMCLALPTVNEIIGNHKMVLRQMIDCVKSLGVTEPPKKWDEWRKFVREAREAVEKRVHE